MESIRGSSSGGRRRRRKGTAQAAGGVRGARATGGGKSVELIDTVSQDFSEHDEIIAVNKSPVV